MGPTLTRAPFPTTTTPLPSLHAHPHGQQQRPPPRRCARTTQVVFLSAPPDSRQVVSSQRKGLEMNRIQSAEGLGVGAPPVFPSEAGIQRWGVGPTLTRTPFLDDTIPATLPPCTAAPTKRAPAPKAMRPHNPRLFSYLHPRLQIPVVSSRRKKLETKRIQPARKLGRGVPPSHHSFEGRNPEGWGVLGGHPGEDCATVRAWTPTAAAPGTAPGTPR